MQGAYATIDQTGNVEMSNDSNNQMAGSDSPIGAKSFTTNGAKMQPIINSMKLMNHVKLLLMQIKKKKKKKKKKHY